MITFVSVSPVLWPLLTFSTDIVLEQIYPSQSGSQGGGILWRLSSFGIMKFINRHVDKSLKVNTFFFFKIISMV